MKRYLRKDRYELTLGEKEQLWRKIRFGANPGSDQSAEDPVEAGRRFGLFGRRRLAPAFGLTTVAALVALTILWRTGGIDKSFEQPLADRTRPGLEQPVPRGPIEMKPDAGPGDEMVLAIEPLHGATVSEPVETDAVNGAVRRDEVAVVEPVTSPATAKSVRPSSPNQVATRAVEETETPTRSTMPQLEIRGRLRDAETGESLPHANILLTGTTRGVAADGEGRFVLKNLTPGEVALKILLLGFAPLDTVLTLAEAADIADLDLQMHPLVVATLQTFDVEGAAYMVERKSAASEHTVGSETFDNYAIKSVEEAISKQAGVAAAPLASRSARERDATTGSVTGGNMPPNGETYELMYFEHTGVNPFVATEDDALSTFAIDVDGASYTVARSYLDRGVLPPRDAIRVEEFVNFFAAGYPEQSESDFAIHIDGAPSRFGAGYHLLRIGLQGLTVDSANRKPTNLTFVIDISGSMSGENRLGLVKRSLRVLLDELREGDSVGIVVYGSRGEVRLQPTDISRREAIENAIAALVTNGSTNAYEGLDLAYQMARANYAPGKINRLILCSDGVANMGPTTKAESILARIRRESDEGISLSTVGFGMGNYNDILMETLADKGDGNYYYVDELKEAERVFRENLTGTLQTIAREVKVQVEFDPERVQRWRLLGYENRDVADEDFRNDDIDAGEVGSGHQVTALYEVKLKPSDEDWRLNADNDLTDQSNGDQLGMVNLRYEAPRHDLERAGQVTEINREIHSADLAGNFSRAGARLRLTAAVAEFAEILRGSYWAKESTLTALIPVVDGLATELNDPDVNELARLVRRAADLQAAATDE